MILGSYRSNSSYPPLFSELWFVFNSAHTACQFRIFIRLAFRTLNFVELPLCRILNAHQKKIMRPTERELLIIQFPQPICGFVQAFSLNGDISLPPSKPRLVKCQPTF